MLERFLFGALLDDERDDALSFPQADDACAPGLCLVLVAFDEERVVALLCGFAPVRVGLDLPCFAVLIDGIFDAERPPAAIAQEGEGVGVGAGQYPEVLHALYEAERLPFGVRPEDNRAPPLVGRGIEGGREINGLLVGPHAAPFGQGCLLYRPFHVGGYADALLHIISHEVDIILAERKLQFASLLDNLDELERTVRLQGDGLRAADGRGVLLDGYRQSFVRFCRTAPVPATREAPCFPAFDRERLRTTRSGECQLLFGGEPCRLPGVIVEYLLALGQLRVAIPDALFIAVHFVAELGRFELPYCLFDGRLRPFLQERHSLFIRPVAILGEGRGIEQAKCQEGVYTFLVSYSYHGCVLFNWLMESCRASNSCSTGESGFSFTARW